MNNKILPICILAANYFVSAIIRIAKYEPLTALKIIFKSSHSLSSSLEPI